ncbi:MAG: anthranilate synthase component I family protein [Candidatus Omnitrophica bacterium]|nr:anthranilate synthase component I family protein [Candidatus Omnitrophota bacterium]
MDPLSVYRLLRSPGKPGVLLESARLAPHTGRYSLVACRPYDEIRSQKNGPDPFAILKKCLRQKKSEARSGFPPFTGGAVGVIHYEARHWIEKRKSGGCHPHDDLGLPEVHFFLFDEGIVFDHAEKAVYGFAKTKRALKDLETQSASARSRAPGRDESQALLKPAKAQCSMTREVFLKSVETIKQFIQKGDIFQANLSQRFTFSFQAAVETVYARLRRINPSAFFGIFDAGDYQILSGSPERLVKVEEGLIQTRPIAGTRQRGVGAAQDEAAGLDLLLSEKERSEHIMLVDLERNDMGRVAEYGSVAVDELMTLEDYSHVKHIVSNVRGTLKAGLDSVDALKAFFPGGTITGAPKIRCMEILDELEPCVRGPYTGSMGYFSFTGNMDFNIIIRSLLIHQGRAHLSVGAGIVADSVPEKEYDETLYKATAVLEALFGRQNALAFLKRCGPGAGRAR